MTLLLTLLFLGFFQYTISSKVETDSNIYPIFYRIHDGYYINLMSINTIHPILDNEIYRIRVKTNSGELMNLEGGYSTLKEAKDQCDKFINIITYYQKPDLSEVLWDDQNKKTLVPKFLKEPKIFNKIISIFCKKYKLNNIFGYVQHTDKCTFENLKTKTDVIMTTLDLKILGYVDIIYNFDLKFKISEDSEKYTSTVNEEIYIITKISSSSISEIIREVNLYRKYRYNNFFILAYDFDLCEIELQILENVNILPIKLDKEFETWFKDNIDEPPIQKSDRLIF